MFASKIFRDMDQASVFQCLFFLIALCAFFSIFSPVFLTGVNIANILTATAVIGLMSVGATFVIAAGAIDLSTAA